MIRPIPSPRRAASGVASARREPARVAASAPSVVGSIREVRLLGGGGAAGAGPIRRAEGVVQWAGRAYRVASHQGEPAYLHLEPLQLTDPTP
jgi:hypothetical protein